ncbi:MAG: tetratricopeptide repeat protein [Rhodopseudomonas sp.]|nr:tetratricopeptide repeat protein [Rhodopseudomonas sp.]
MLGARAYDHYLKYKIRRDIRLGSGKKISILIARLAEDTGDSYRTTLWETLRRELGDAVELISWPDVETLGDGHEYDVEQRAQTKRQKLLTERSCDLMISGRVKGKSVSTTVLSLRITAAAADPAQPQSYTLTETFDLPVAFIGNIGAALAARVVMAAAPAVDLSGHYLVPLMRASAERLAPLVAKLHTDFDADTRGQLLFSQALILSTIGEQAGDNDALATAIDTYRTALIELTRDRVPLDWAMTQNNLGNALQALGERESGTERLEQAIEAYRAALSERTRDHVPLDWAMTQHNLGTALQVLGERENNTEGLEQAVNAFRAALIELTRDRVPLDWAMTQNNLGNALQILGERESGTERLEQAIEAYRAALTERTRDRVPLNWATTQNNLGTALETLGERESGTERLEQAIEAYRAALEVFTEAKADYYIKGTTANLARAEAKLAERRTQQ